MEDVKRVWRFLVAVLHAVFAVIDYFARGSPFILGFVLIALAVLVTIYQRRRRFYGGLDTAGDWAPRYGDIVSARAADTSLTICVRLAAFIGIMVLFQHALPILYDDTLGALVRVTR